MSDLFKKMIKLGAVSIFILFSVMGLLLSHFFLVSYLIDQKAEDLAEKLNNTFLAYNMTIGQTVEADDKKIIIIEQKNSLVKKWNEEHLLFTCTALIREYNPGTQRRIDRLFIGCNFVYSEMLWGVYKEYDHKNNSSLKTT